MSARLPLTLCVHTLNEAHNLRACVESARAWAEEILIADMGSTDGTLEIAEGFGARILHLPPSGFVEPGRQIAIDAASSEWILILDADERATESLMEAVAAWVQEPDLHGVLIARHNRVFGRWLRGSGFWPDYQLRLLRRGSATWPATVHRTPLVRGRTLHGPADPGVAIQHHSHSTLEAFLAKTNRYTTLELEAPGNQVSFRRRGLIVRPLVMALQSYFRGRGYRDGVQGIWIALMMGIYGLEVELKRWERDVRGPEISRESAVPSDPPDRPATRAGTTALGRRES